MDIESDPVVGTQSPGPNSDFSTKSSVLSGLSYITYTLVFIVFLRYYSKGSDLKGSFKRKTEKHSENNNGDKPVVGLEAVHGPKPFLNSRLFGHYPYFLPYSETLNKSVAWGLEYPGIAKMCGLYQDFVGLHSGPLVQQLFKSVDFGHNVKSPLVYDTMKPFITNGVLVSTGKFWQGQRKILLKSQSFQSLKAYMGMLNKHSRNFVEDLDKLFRDGKPHQINETVNITFLKVINEMITGYSVHSSSEFDRYHHNFQTWKESLIKRILHPYLLLKPFWRLHPISRKHDKAVKEMFDFASQRIKEHRAKREIREKLSEHEQKLPDFIPEDTDKPKFRCVLDDLVDAGVPERQIIDEVNTMLFGGHETGASAIHCFCFAIALNPEIQELCRNEIDQIYDDPSLVENGEITYEAAQNHLKYLERCILETLRLFPPVFIFLRKLKSPLRLDHDNKIIEIPKNTNIAVMPYILHRIPEYFPDPERFDPDRFLPEEVSKRHPYAFLPFSGGQRSCLGMKFAMIEMKIVAAYLLRNFCITTTDKMKDIPLLPFITLTPARDYTFEFKRRLL